MRTVFCGLTTIDLIQNVEHVPAANEKVVANGALLDVGGPAANAARIAAILGAEPTLISPIGTGVFGTMALSWLNDCGVHTIDLASDGDPAISAVAIDACGDRTVISTNSSGRSHTFPSADVLDNAAALLIDGHLPDVQLPLARTAQQLGIPVVFDGGSYKDGTVALLPYVSHGIFSADFVLPGAEDQLLEMLAWRGMTLAARSNGNEPVEAIVGGKYYSLSVPHVPATQVVDTLGAGDALHGAFTAALAAGQSELQALSGAIDIASRSVRGLGAIGWALTNESRGSHTSSVGTPRTVTPE
ncbi:MULTISPECIES: PfkB family carbohydrate kinase [unclassified Actinobaculum]|uniref:PfkB family carbohydrate kinase n=1 Tax=unclassified Actinobaculum TaxID=2609299 RepID=UPI000D52592C|nr:MULTISPECIES: PfkB family carbohydrate kinase [unclassified Actinobaculum]AWE42329.1 carbohydrate kinase [Actinobaculum sp. 313]RTE50901.1 carbohydrate kinase [Actinobaculum sp. 352]